MTIKQTQNPDQIFQIPLAIDVYQGATKVRHQVWIKNAQETFTFDYTTKPDLINIDAEKVMLWDKTDNKTLDNLIFQYTHAGNYADRREAIVGSFRQLDKAPALALVKTGMRDRYEGLRNLTIERLDTANHDLMRAVEPILLELAKNDKKSNVRANAMERLADLKKSEYKDLFIANLKDSSYSVAGVALEGLVKLDSETGLAEAKKQMAQPAKGRLAVALMGTLMDFGSENDFDFIAGKYGSQPLTQAKFETTVRFASYLGDVKSTEKVKKGVDMIVSFRESIPHQYRNQTDGPINQMILGALMTRKQGDGLKDQAEYIKSKLP